MIKFLLKKLVLPIIKDRRVSMKKVKIKSLNVIITMTVVFSVLLYTMTKIAVPRECEGKIQIILIIPSMDKTIDIEG